MMNLAITLSNEELSQLRDILAVQDDAEAVSKAARDYLRLVRLRELKSASGRVDFDDNWRELEKVELDRIEFPQ